MFNPITTLLAHPVFDVLGLIYDVLSATAFLWGPLLLLWFAKNMWLAYRQSLFVAKNYEFIMLEIKLPRIIDKTPIAMELVLQAFQERDRKNWWKRWWHGRVRPWFSLEVVSLEGNVKFFIRTPSRFKKVIESHIYAQYPDIEVHEVPDYVSLAPYVGEKDEWSMWGCEFKLLKPDPYPIKTYVDYGLDSTMTKEEQKSDPITSLIEFLGNVGRGQHVWFQIIIQATGERYKTPGTLFGRHDWKDEGKKIIKELQGAASQGEGGERSRATKRQQEIVTAIEKSLSKPAFDCGIRALYLAKREQFDPANIAGITGAFRQYNSADLNGFKPTNTTGFDYPWQDFHGIRVNKLKKRFFDAYVRRAYFHAPYKQTPFVLNTEELATIFHFPGGVAETPTFARIESRKGEPPPNLPI